MIPTVAYSAENQRAHLDLDLIDARDHSRVRYKRVSEESGEEVPWKSIVKGFKVGDDRYVSLTAEDFREAAAKVAKGGIQIVDFVERESVSPVYFEKPYYLAPNKGGDKGYVLLREVLRKTDRIGIAKAVISTREHLAALMVQGNALLLVTMRFDEDLRDPAGLGIPRASSLRLDPRELAMAKQLVDGMSGAWQPSKYRDEYHRALRSIIAAKSRRKGGETPKGAAYVDEEIPPTYSFMDLLRKSVKGQPQPSKGARPRRSRAPSRRAKKAG